MRAFPVTFEDWYAFLTCGFPVIGVIMAECGDMWFAGWAWIMMGIVMFIVDQVLP